MEAGFSREELTWKVSPLSDLDIIKSACPESFHLESFHRTHPGLPLQPRGYCIFFGGKEKLMSWASKSLLLMADLSRQVGLNGVDFAVFFFFDGFAFAMRFPVEFS